MGLVHERYNDKSYLIADANELRLSNESEVVIYRETECHDEIVVDLEGQEERFEELKTRIAFAAGNLCKMDSIAQEYDGTGRFADDFAAAYIRLDGEDVIIITYFGTYENTEFDVVFQYNGDRFVLKSFGTTDV